METSRAWDLRVNGGEELGLGWVFYSDSPFTLWVDKMET